MEQNENKNAVSVSIYKITGCKVKSDYIFDGYVLRVNDEDITKSIRRKLDMGALLCEITNEGFEYNIASLFSVPITELSIGELLVIFGNDQLINLAQL